MSELGHNGGPPLEDEHVPEWGRGGPGTYFAWKSAHEAVWKAVPWDTMMRRQRRAELIGLTYEEYTLELLERGRYLGPDDVERIEAIKRARPAPALVAAPARPPRSAKLRPAVSIAHLRRPARG
jgi:hypothetical protein